MTTTTTTVFPTGYRENVAFRPLEIAIGTKVVTMVPCDHKQESGNYVFVGWRPVNSKTGKVYTSTTLTTLNEKLTKDFRGRTVKFGNNEEFPFIASIPTARVGTTRKNPIRKAEREFTVQESNGMLRAVKGTVTLGGPDDRGNQDVLSLTIVLVGTSQRGRKATGPASSEDDF